MQIAMIQDKIIPFEQVDPALLDRGTFFGDGVYEVMRSYDGKLFAIDEHLRRFANSLSAIEITGLAIDEIREAFFEHFVNLESHLVVNEYELVHLPGGGNVHCKASISVDGKPHNLEGDGNGPINSFVHALETVGLKDFKVTDYRSHAVRGGSDANAAAYVQLQHDDGRMLWGTGVDPSIEMAGLKALVTGWNLLR